MPRFAFDFGHPLAAPLRLFGIRPDTASVLVEDGRLWLSHPGLTVTVQDPGSLRTALLAAQRPVREAPAQTAPPTTEAPAKKSAPSGPRVRRSPQSPASAG